MKNFSFLLKIIVLTLAWHIFSFTISSLIMYHNLIGYFNSIKFTDILLNSIGSIFICIMIVSFHQRGK